MAEEEVGSLGHETLKLLRVLATEATPGSSHGVDGPEASDGSRPSSEHVCSTGWCPVCRVVGFVKENPDVVDEVAASALHLARAVRDALDLAVRQSGRDTDGSPT